MNKSISDWQISGFIFTSILGVLLHFLFELTGENLIVAPFSAVNESTWEHMKLIFFPMLIYSIIEGLFVNKENYWCVKLLGIVTGTVLIPVLFYTIGGAFGKTPDFVNIVIFFLSAFAAYILEARLLEKGIPNCNRSKFPGIVLLVVAVLFIIFTFYPPDLPIFRDPVSGKFGI